MKFWRQLYLLLALLLITSSTLAQEMGTPLTQSVFSITPGSFEGNISDFSPQLRYSFEAEADTTYVIRMNRTSGDLDPFLFLFTANNELIDSNDDEISGNRNALIRFTPAQDRVLIIEATRFDQELGETTGTFVLSLETEGSGTTEMVMDPLSIPPSFGVDFRLVEFDTFETGVLTEDTDHHYFVMGARQGDFVRLILTTDGDFQPSLRILNQERIVISRESQVRSDEIIAYATIPQDGWHLVEIDSNTSIGSYTLYTTRLTDAVIGAGETVSGDFTPETTILSYIFDATIGDRIFASLTPGEDSDIEAEISVFDRSLNPLAQSTRPTVRTIIPRSGSYIVQVRNNNINGGGKFDLTLNSIPVAIDKLDAQPATYNNRYKGNINVTKAIDYYRFSGKKGEAVTIEMRRTDATESLDPYLILADFQLQELTFSDNVNNTNDARVTRFVLPEDNDYYILATRAGLGDGDTVGEYDLEMTVGDITETPGFVTVKLTWQGDADLNLFMRLPSGQIVSWSNPAIPEQGILQIDSNTRCETPTAQPIEYIYTPGGERFIGEFTIWVWYQNPCMMSMPTTFLLEVYVDGAELMKLEDEVSLEIGDRFETSFRVTNDNMIITESGIVSQPSPQENASQGGDIPIRYEQEIVGTITDEVFGRFYQFSGLEGDEVVISAQTVAGNLDPIIILRNGNDDNISINDDALGTNDSLLEYTLPTSGRYTIAVTRYGLQDGTTSGDFRLSLARRSEDNP